MRFRERNISAYEKPFQSFFRRLLGVEAEIGINDLFGLFPDARPGQVAAGPAKPLSRIPGIGGLRRHR
jgi:hypothetical protein